MTWDADAVPAGGAREADRPLLNVRVAACLRRALSLLLAVGGVSLAVPAPVAGQGSWTPTGASGAPAARAYHTAVWTGSRMIVWGGYDGSGDLDSGGAYDPATDGWAATSTTGAPAARSSHTAVWTGSKMIVWGGWGPDPFDTGGIYDPAADTWTATSVAGAPSARVWHTAVWTGSKMIVWGGMNLSTHTYYNTGGIYDPATDTWTAVSVQGAPAARRFHSAIWTGSRMIVWGGVGDAGLFSTGGIYDPATNTWAPTSTYGAPIRRITHSAVWTGSRMIVWGGVEYFSTPVGTGGIYDPATNTWAPTNTSGAPVSRSDHGAVWTGSRMVIWGGSSDSIAPSYDTGGTYDPAADT
jgi:N-acetylneuraminic acid mutarotase